MLPRLMLLTQFRKARFLATASLVAAVLVFSLQALELQHQHALDESQVQCLICKTSAEGATVLADVSITTPTPHSHASFLQAPTYFSANKLRIPIRGPPA
jgi:hypothetical protein